MVGRLIERADVVLHNFLPDAAVRYGADAAAVHAVNPLAVHCTITGYPYRRRPASSPGYDFLMQGIGGIMSITRRARRRADEGRRCDRRPGRRPVRGPGVLSALVERAVTGAGRTLEVALIDAQVSWLANRAGDWLITGIEPERLGNAHPSIVPYETFRASDGYINLAVGHRRPLPPVLHRGRPRRPRRRSPLPHQRGRVERREQLVPQLQALISPARSTSGSSCSSGARVPGGPVLTIPETFAGPAAHMVERVKHPTAGQIGLVRSPCGWPTAGPERGIPPPRLGEHADEVLTELGYCEPSATRCSRGALPGQPVESRFPRGCGGIGRRARFRSVWP